MNEPNKPAVYLYCLKVKRIVHKEEPTSNKFDYFKKVKRTVCKEELNNMTKLKKD